MPWAFPIDRRPFILITDLMGLARRARERAVYRRVKEEKGKPAEPAQPWERAAVELDAQLWASLYRPGVDALALARRVVEVQARSCRTSSWARQFSLAERLPSTSARSHDHLRHLRSLENPLTDELLREVQAQLGHKLPAAYVDLARRHNGGVLARDAHPSPSRTSWSAGHVAVYTLAAIGDTASFSLCGELGNAFWTTEWGYPDIGVYIADCPSAGHDMIALDYRSPGEPTVVHVDQEWNYQITVIAPDFETFLGGLVDAAEFDGDD